MNIKRTQKLFICFIVFFIAKILLAADNQTFDHIIYIIPPEGYHNEKLFDMDDSRLNRDNCMYPFFYLRKSLRKFGYDLKTLDTISNRLAKFAGLIVCGIPRNKEALKIIKRFPSYKVILILLEPATVEPDYYDRSLDTIFGKIFTMFDDEVDSIKYHKLYYPQPTLEMTKDRLSFEEKKFCAMIAANKSSLHENELYSERKKIINFFECAAYNMFDLYGYGWPASRCYKGSIQSKIEILKSYKFCICYENTHEMNGYITEKIFDAFIAGCIPIYKGAPNISNYIDQECFINRDHFQTDEALFNFLLNITPDQYDYYLQSIEKYLKSSKAFLFSSEYFACSIINKLIGNIDASSILNENHIKLLNVKKLNGFSIF